MAKSANKGKRAELSTDMVPIDKLAEIVAQNTTQMAETAKVFGEILKELAGMKSEIRDLKKYVNEGAAKPPKEDIERITDEQKKNLSAEINAKIFRILNLPYDESEYTLTDWQDRKVYFGKFRSTLINDAKKRGGMGSRMEDTPREDYSSVIAFIRGWIPVKGVEGLKNVALQSYIATHATMYKGA